MNKDFEISVAPMMDWTDRHCRYFHRLIAPHVRLYTEMVTTGALLHGDAGRFLRFDKSEHPVALQLGGSDPVAMAECAMMAQQHGYDEVNINVGCPSDRVQNGRFGACLMAEPDLVAACVDTMRTAVDIPVTVKTRIGIDHQDSPEFLYEFVEKSADKGCTTFIIHARKAWLKGLSPKENRTKPPIMYDRVRAVKNRYPHLRIILNGEIKTAAEAQNFLRNSEQTDFSFDQARGAQSAKQHLSDEQRSQKENMAALDGVMIGREAYSNPYFLAEIERRIFGYHQIKGREKIARAMVEYATEQREKYGTPVKSITRHILGLYHHQPGAKQWRRALSTLPYEDGADHTVILKALDAVQTSQKQAA